MKTVWLQRKRGRGLAGLIADHVKRCGCGDVCTLHCWEWQGYQHQQGYGETLAIINGRRERYAHRIAWYAAHGTLGELKICHRCDNPPCCNPSHLWQGTQADNLADMVAKGRAVHPCTPRKLTADQVHAIWARILDGSCDPQRVIAAEFGVSQPTISHIKAGRVWRACRPVLESAAVRE